MALMEPGLGPRRMLVRLASVVLAQLMRTSLSRSSRVRLVQMALVRMVLVLQELLASLGQRWQLAGSRRSFRRM